MRLDGGRWAQIYDEDCGGTDCSAYVAASRPDRTWMIWGKPYPAEPPQIATVVKYWEGGSWHNVDERPPHLTGPMWVGGDRDVWVMELNDHVPNQLFHYDGKWTEVHLDIDPSAVWGRSPSDVWVVGKLGYVSHWNGAAWADDKTPTEAGLLAVTGTANGEVWAVGEKGVIMHFVPE